MSAVARFRDMGLALSSKATQSICSTALPLPTKAIRHRAARNSYRQSRIFRRISARLKISKAALTCGQQTALRTYRTRQGVTMDIASSFVTFLNMVKTLTADNRPLRMRLALPTGIVDDLLLPQRVEGSESICGGLEYHVDCVATDAKLPLKQFIAIPAELQFVTDRGGLRKVSGIVTQAKAGRSDGGLASYQLVVRDAFAIMEQRVNTRVFRNANEIDILEILFNEWQQNSGVLAAAFDIEIDPLIFSHQYPQREFTKQHNESDAAFIMRLMKRRGIAWFFRAGHSGGAASGDTTDDTPAHTLVLFDDASSLQENAAGTVRYHRDNATEQRDTITAWSAVRTLRPASVSRHSWNYKNPLGSQFMTTNANSSVDQGDNGNAMAANLNDYLIEIPHVGDDHEDQALLGQVRLSRHDYETKCFHGEGGVRDLCVGEYNGVSGHPEIDTHADSEREFVITELHLVAENNLSPELERSLRSLFSSNRWHDDEVFDWMTQRTAQGAVRYGNRFTCVRRGVAIVPAFDPRVDVPKAQMESAIVVGPAGEEIHCDEEGRVRLRHPGTRTEDHTHAAGAGASDTDGDSAWVRVASSWAGPGPGGDNQPGLRNLPRVGTEVLVAYLGGDPDKPVIVGQLYNSNGLPPGLNSVGGLPDSKYLTGIQSREGHGMRSNQLRLDDTPKQISAQLASAHGASELNLGYLTTPRFQGKGTARGEGAELRSDKAVALRGAQGILLSTASDPDGPGAQLDRAELIGMVEVLQGVAEQLATFAATHAGDDANGPQVAQLIAKLKAWDSGSNVAACGVGWRHWRLAHHRGKRAGRNGAGQPGQPGPRRVEQDRDAVRRRHAAIERTQAVDAGGARGQSVRAETGHEADRGGRRHPHTDPRRQYRDHVDEAHQAHRRRGHRHRGAGNAHRHQGHAGRLRRRADHAPMQRRLRGQVGTLRPFLGRRRQPCQGEFSEVDAGDR